MELIVIGLNHKTAPIEIRERLTLSKDQLESILSQMKSFSAIEEGMVLSTSHRTEIYAIVRKEEEALSTLMPLLSQCYHLSQNESERSIYFLVGEDVVRHLFRMIVISDSIFVGEPHILAQIQSAYNLATESETSGLVLYKLHDSAFRIAERIRAEVKIRESAITIGFVVLELTKNIFGPLEKKTLLLIGMGERCEEIARQLISGGIEKLYIAHPDHEYGLSLARELNGESLRFEDILQGLGMVDIVISSIGSSRYLLRHDQVTKLIRERKQKPIFFIDIAVPRDIEPTVDDIENIYIYDLDDLQKVVNAYIQDRGKEAQIEAIIQSEIAKFINWFQTLKITPTPVVPRMIPHEIRIGTRGSQLALCQAHWVKEQLFGAHPHLKVSLTKIKTTGDKVQDTSFSKIGGKGVFVKEIEEKLLQKKIDLAVHSIKDVPSELPEGLCLSAFTKRLDPRDVFISRDGTLLKDLPEGAKIGTSSLRRQVQLLHFRPDFQIVPLRGNVDTRLKKMEAMKLDGIVLAFAGIQRIGLEDRITEIIPLEIALPPVGQGSLGIETRIGDEEIEEFIQFLNDPPSSITIAAERAFLKRLQGGCQVPIAAYGSAENETFQIEGMVGTIDGKKIIQHKLEGPLEKAESLGIELAEILLNEGASEILEEFYHKPDPPLTYED